MGNKALEAICDALKHCTKLQEIYLYNNELDDEPLESFCKLLSNQSEIFTLGLEFNHIGYRGACMIFSALKNKTKLEKLYLN